MELIAGRFVSRVFWAELHVLGGADVGNVLGFIYRDKGEDHWQAEYRFRYYVDDDLTQKSKDRKSGYTITARKDATLADMIGAFKVIFNAAGLGKYEEIFVESDDPAVVLARMTEQEWAHVSMQKAKP